MINNNKIQGMYKLLILFFAAIIMSCGNNIDHESHLTNNDKEKYDQHMQPAALSLNNGSKWKLDAPTRDNIAEIKTYVSDSSHFTDHIKGYEGLKKQTDNLIKECRMSGPDHDALHVWLSPFIKDVERLNKPGEEKEAYVAISNHLREFDVYFE